MHNYATIPNFEQLTQQQLFDMSANHIASTRTQSVSSMDKTVCVYGGSGCAAAPFLQESRREELDNMGINWRGLTKEHLVPEHHSVFVGRLQNCHDGARAETFLVDFVWAMQSLGAACKLDITVLDQFGF